MHTTEPRPVPAPVLTACPDIPADRWIWTGPDQLLAAASPHGPATLAVVFAGETVVHHLVDDEDEGDLVDVRYRQMYTTAARRAAQRAACRNAVPFVDFADPNRGCVCCGRRYAEHGRGAATPGAPGSSQNPG